MAAPHIPPVNDAIAASSTGLERGALATLATALGVSRNAVTTWFSGRATPDKTYWPAIEEHLGMIEGTLARIAARYFDPSVVALEAMAASAEQFAVAARPERGKAAGLPKTGGERSTTRPRPVEQPDD